MIFRGCGMMRVYPAHPFKSKLAASESGRNSEYTICFDVGMQGETKAQVAGI